MNQDNLIPLKFMASQLAIELTLENPQVCIYQSGTWNLSSSSAGTGTAAVFASTVTPTYSVSSFNLIPEIWEFDSEYDSMFLQGVNQGGIPIKFSSWHTFQYPTLGGSSCRLQVNEGVKSIKSMFCIQTYMPPDITYDSHGSIESSGVSSFMVNYQWKIGNKYYPPSPVQGKLEKFNATNHGCEAFVELQKALKTLGNSQISSEINTIRWAIPMSTIKNNLLDYDANFETYTSTGGISATYPTLPESGVFGSACYAAAINLENTNGVDISGCNAQDTAEIAFIGQWSSAQNSTYTLTVFVYYDAIFVLKPNNVVELIQ
jgi:hypothetical protein